MWKKVERNPNYSINEQGNIKNNNTGKILRPHKNKNTGYYCIDLWENNKSKRYAVHRLVAETFIPNPNDKPCVDHIDGDRTNNNVSNLRWATYGENNSRFGECGVRSEKVKVIRYNEERKKRGGGHIKWNGVAEIKNFDSLTDVAEYFNCNISNISQMLKKGTIGVRGRTRGYKFEYTKSERCNDYRNGVKNGETE